MNEGIIKHLKNIAVMYQEENNTWKNAAFNKAADAVVKLNYELTSDISEIALVKIPGIGKSIARTIKEVLEKGTSERLSSLEEKADIKLDDLEKLKELTKIPKIGIKTAKNIYKVYRISTLKELKEAVDKNKITGTLAKTIKEGLAIAEAATARIPWFKAAGIASVLLKELQNICTRIEPAGSLRRVASTIRDFDFVAIADPKKIIKFLNNHDFSYDLKVKVVQEGSKKIMLEIEYKGDTRRADIVIATVQSFGNSLNYLTGSRDFNIKLRQLALKRGYTVNEHFTVKKETKEQMPSAKEQDLYSLLNIPFVPPECRITGKEIEDKKYSNVYLFPKNTKIIKGDLHIHSNNSDGSYSVEVLIKMAKEENYDFIGISDHNSGITGGPSPKTIRNYINKIRQASKSHNFPVYAGLELDILIDGRVRFDIDKLGDLDYVMIVYYICRIEYRRAYGNLRLWRWFVGTVVEARKRMLSKLSRSHGACLVECHSIYTYTK